MKFLTLLLLASFSFSGLKAQVAEPEMLAAEWLEGLLKGDRSQMEAHMATEAVMQRVAKALYLREFKKTLTPKEQEKVGGEMYRDMTGRADKRYTEARRYLETHPIEDNDIRLTETTITLRKKLGEDLEEYRAETDLTLRDGNTYRLAVDMLRTQEGYYLSSGVIIPGEWYMPEGE
ncbi:MAG: hypothetical protein KF690_10385 [Bacteroidetes bacterium]|nr:hypothetical protein [Bacteroidota bacterium]